MRYVFGDVTVELDAETITCAGAPVAVEPKAFRLLVFLIENRGKLVEKQEILDAVWEGAFVTDNALTRVIGQLRKAIKDEAKNPMYIETVPTRGYRFIADVETLAADRRPLNMLVALVAASLFVAVAIWIVSKREPPQLQTISTWRPSQITTSPALDTYPALSPDGTAVAYSSDRGGGFEIYVRQLAPGGDEVQLTTGGDQNLQPAWSPDGTPHRVSLQAP